MISAKNLYLLFVGDIFPKCVNCVHFKPGVVSPGYCKLYGEILEARLNKCGILGIDYKEINKIKLIKKN
jgi:hypothetical protein